MDFSKPKSESSLIQNACFILFLWIIKPFCFFGLSFLYYTTSLTIQLGIWLTSPKHGKKTSNTLHKLIPPDATNQSAIDLILKKGYQFESHKIVTEDGYILTGWRIRKEVRHPNPIILMHGLLDCSWSWVMNNTKKQCLPYILADEGFDVWCMNNRGNKYSIGHTQLHNIIYNPEYWNYTFDDLVRYDVKALINYTKRIANVDQVIYIGHSQGTTQMLAYLSTDIDFQKNLKSFIGLGPALYIFSQKSKLINFSIKFRIFELIEYIGIPYFFVFDDRFNYMIGALCYMMPGLFRSAWFWVTQQLCGYPSRNKIELEKFGQMVAHEPGGCSTKNILQWMQFFRSQQLQYYDFGPSKNLELYQQETPPRYPLENLKQLRIPKFLYLGTKDIITDTEDLDKMLNVLDKTNLKVEFLEDYAHLDYVWSMDAYQVLYPKLLRDIYQS